MTRELDITVDKNGFVQDVSATGDRWRFKRVRPFHEGGRRRLTIEQEQEICAMYVDHPNRPLREIEKDFGLAPGGLHRTVEAYDLPKRRAKKNGRPKLSAVPPSQGTVLSLSPLGYTTKPAPDARPVWSVTVTRTVVEEVHADTLLDLAAHYDGTDAQIIRIERKP